MFLRLRRAKKQALFSISARNAIPFGSMTRCGLWSLSVLCGLPKRKPQGHAARSTHHAPRTTSTAPLTSSGSCASSTAHQTPPLPSCVTHQVSRSRARPRLVLRAPCYACSGLRPAQPEPQAQRAAAGTTSTVVQICTRGAVSSLPVCSLSLSAIRYTSASLSFGFSSGLTARWAQGGRSSASIPGRTVGLYIRTRVRRIA